VSNRLRTDCLFSMRYKQFYSARVSNRIGTGRRHFAAAAGRMPRRAWRNASASVSSFPGSSAARIFPFPCRKAICSRGSGRELPRHAQAGRKRGANLLASGTEKGHLYFLDFYIVLRYFSGWPTRAMRGRNYRIEGTNRNEKPHAHTPSMGPVKTNSDVGYPPTRRCSSPLMRKSLFEKFRRLKLGSAPFFVAGSCTGRRRVSAG
jgi:hypothetical protein